MDRAALIGRITDLLADWGAGERQALEIRVDALLDGASDSELEAAARRLATTGTSWGFHPHDRIFRALSRFAHTLVLLPGSRLESPDALSSARREPVFFVANHLSYIDANVIDALFVAGGYEDVANGLTVLAGPKVYSFPIGRMASLCFGTIKLPQSQSTASGEAVMPRREVARLATETLATVEERRQKGEQLLVFVEGTRSRTASMQRVLPAAARYFEAPGTRIVPVGLWGTDRLMQVETDRVVPSEVHARVGPLIDARALFERADGKRPVVADALGYLIADLLPESYRGEYSDPNLAPPAREAAKSFSR